MGLPGPTELLIIFGVLVLMFGATKLPKLGGAVGESIRNFKKGIKGEEQNNEGNGDQDASGNSAIEDKSKDQ